MTVYFLELEEVLRLHFQLIEDFGGAHGVRDGNRLKSAVESPKQEAFGQEQYPSLFEKAAVYLRNISGDRPFIDGNKRTAITVCGIFLMHNRYSLIASPKDLEEFTVQVATEHLSIEHIANRLKQYSQISKG